MNNEVLKIINESVSVKNSLKNDVSTILSISELVSKTINRGKTVYLFGNGGSASDAQHIAGEFVGQFNKKRNGLPAVALTTNTSILTAIANDLSFEQIFQRQVESVVTKNDLVIGISTSGNSINVINGIKAAKKIGSKTIGLTGRTGGKLKKFADITLCVSSNNTQRIQESHLLIGHIICDYVEKNLSVKKS